MSKQDSVPNRHHFRVWIKQALESGLLDKVAPLYDPEGCMAPQPIDQYARGLLAELRDPGSSTRPLKQIIADARQFRIWVEACQKRSRRIIMTEINNGDIRDLANLDNWFPQKRPANTAAPDESSASTPLKTPHPRRNPMWDDWVDG
jgi:hypothetical protein